jgi:Fop (Friend of PRMT1)-like protein
MARRNTSRRSRAMDVDSTGPSYSLSPRSTPTRHPPRSTTRGSSRARGGSTLSSRFQSYYVHPRASPSPNSQRQRSVTFRDNGSRTVSGGNNRGRGRGGRPEGGARRGTFEGQRSIPRTSRPPASRGRAGPSRGRRPAPPTAGRLDRDLDAYMLRDKSTGTKLLDADLDSYMMGAGGSVVTK